MGERWTQHCTRFRSQDRGFCSTTLGSLLAICDNGEFQGSVSGGCVENAVIEEAQIIMRTGVPRTLSYGVADETAWELGLPCGEPLKYGR
ncbi:MAG: hypothetical protein Ct9H300mP13_5730 [Gammaproteobacteria bacterium]|nr:MAG: hypothetical protein Ct9H300mP13_5730 [Gammaproteobacteria bacterium]